MASRSNSSLFNRIALVLACTGIFIAGTLTYAELTDLDVPCGGGTGCATVAADASSHFLGIPTAAFGLAAYLTLAVLSLWRLLSNRPTAFQPIGLGVTCVGAVVSVGLISYGHYMLHALCLWCLGSAITMILSLAVQVRLASLAKDDAGLTHGKHNVDWLLATVGVLGALGGIYVQAHFFRVDKSLELTRNIAANLPYNTFVPPGANSLGSPNAPLTIVEFADFACPACRAMFPRIENLIKHHPGRVRLVFHHLPFPYLIGHEDSARAAVLSETAAQSGRFGDFADAVYAAPHTPSLAQYRAILRRLCPSAGQESPSAQARVLADIALAKRLRIGQTPTFVFMAPGIPTEVATSGNFKDVIVTPAYLQILGG